MVYYLIANRCVNTIFDFNTGKTIEPMCEEVMLLLSRVAMCRVDRIYYKQILEKDTLVLQGNRENVINSYINRIMA